MASVYPKNGVLYARLKGAKRPGKWGSRRTPFREGQEALAKRWAKEAQARIDFHAKSGARPTLAGDKSFRAYIARWLDRRRQSGHDWKQDKGRLEKHVLPVLGDLDIDSIHTFHIADLVRRLRFPEEGEPIAQRTVRNVYSVVAAAFRDAAADGIVTATPCVLTTAQLGPIVDKDPEWRTSAVFTREEAEQMISDERIPFDRRLYYAFGLLAGLRPGEIAALRWRHYDAAEQPLSRLVIARAYNTKRNLHKLTKTETSKTIPVHPTLAAMIAEWKLSGWSRMTGRAVTADDLVLPLPPETIAKQTKRKGGEPFRGYDYAGRRWREVDLKTLGLRHRSLYDTKATFITLAIEDGASPAIIRDRVTHTKQQRSAFDGYDRGPHWIATCAEVGKLKLARLATRLLPTTSDSNDHQDFTGSGGGLRRPHNEHERPRVFAVLDGGRPGTDIARNHSWTIRVARLATELAAVARLGDVQKARWLISDIAMQIPAVRALA